MDSNAAAKLLQRPPQQPADDDKLPAPALAPSSEGSRRQRTLSAKSLRVIAVLALVSDYLRIVGQNPSDWVWLALLALAYAVVAALICFIGWLERRRRLLQAADGRVVDAPWEGRVKLAARFLVYAIIGGLVGYSSSMTPYAFFVFMWVKSGDQVYIEVQKEEESDEEKKYQV